MKTRFSILIIILFISTGITNSHELCSRSKLSFTAPRFVVNDTTIDIKYYKLNLRLTSNPNFLFGITDVKGDFMVNNNSLFLNLSNTLLVDSVTGSGVTGFSHNNDLLYVNFVSAQNQFDIKIYYKGLPSNSGYGSFMFSSHSSIPVIWSLSEPFGSSDWFPNKNSPSDKADSSEVWITCADNLTGVSNGLLYETLTNPDNTKTYKWKSRYPISSYLISIAVTNYTLYKNYFRYSQNDSMSVDHYIYPEHLNNYKTNLDKTPKMLEVFSKLYSLYPFINEKYGHAEFNWGGGMEHQTISSMGSFGQGIISHELAHQWYGDKITCKTFNHIWLNEGFATYSESAFLEEVQGKDVYISSINSRMLDAKTAKGSIYVANTNNINEIFNSSRTYSKGAIVLHMLRGVIGDSLFYKTLQTYANDTALAYKNATTEDFQRVAEQVSGKNLNYFFAEWIYGENYPKYQISYTENRKENGTTDLNVNISQSQNTTPQYFSMPCDIKITTTKGDTMITVFNNSLNQNFQFNLKGDFLNITFDPDNKILKDKIGDEPAESIDFRLFQNYPNPFNPSTKIIYMIKSTSDVALKIYDTCGKQISVLVNQKQTPGIYSVQFDSNDISSGIYFYKLNVVDLTGRTGGFTDTKRMVFLK